MQCLNELLFSYLNGTENINYRLIKLFYFLKIADAFVSRQF